MANDLQRRLFLGDLDRSRRVGQSLEDAFVTGMTGFDPYASYREATQGAFGDFRRQFTDQLRALRGQQVGMGRINTGFATADEDRLFTELGSRLLDTLSQGAMQAGQQRLQQLGQMGDYASQQRGLAMEGAFGDWATRYQQRAADQASKRSMWGNIIGAGLGLVGTALGGPIGSALGGWVGNKLGVDIFANRAEGRHGPSDERLKMNASPIADALGVLREIPGQTWEWNDLGAALTGQVGPDAGVMAQDVARAFPQAAAVDPMTGALGVNYGTEDTSMVGLLTQAVRELDAKVNILEAALLGQAPAQPPMGPPMDMPMGPSMGAGLDPSMAMAAGGPEMAPGAPIPPEPYPNPYGLPGQGTQGDLAGLEAALLGARGMMG